MRKLKKTYVNFMRSVFALCWMLSASSSSSLRFFPFFFSFSFIHSNASIAFHIIRFYSWSVQCNFHTSLLPFAYRAQCAVAERATHNGIQIENERTYTKLQTGQRNVYLTSTPAPMIIIMKTRDDYVYYDNIGSIRQAPMDSPSSSFSCQKIREY